MYPQLILIKNPLDLAILREHIASDDIKYVAFDTETTGLTKRDEVIGYSVCASEDKAYYIVLNWWNTVDQRLEYFHDMIEASKDFMWTLQCKQLVMHNGVFDCYMVESYFRVSLIDSLHTDTMILAHLLDENRKVGLKELAKARYGEDSAKEQAEMKASITANGGVLTKDKYELYKADYSLIGKYGAKDALLTYKLFVDMVPELYEQNLDKFFYEDESMPLLRGPTYDLNTTGLQVDVPQLQALKRALEAESLEAKEFIFREIAPHIKERYPGTNKKNLFNIGSNQHLAWLLFGELGLEFDRLTDGGIDLCRKLDMKVPYVRGLKRQFIENIVNMKDQFYTPDATINGKLKKGKKIKEPWGYIAVDNDTLRKLAPKYKWIAKLLEYKKKMKLLSTYIEGIEDKIFYSVIHPSYLQHGTTSGRYSSRTPNFQNLPRDDERIKACMVARPGKVFVSSDYSQLEPRIFAFTSQDERLMAVFNDNKADFYSVIGMDVYNLIDCTPQKEGSPNAFGVKYKRYRDWAKTIALAATYGASARQLMKTTGKSQDDTQMDIDNYFDSFPKVKDMMLESHKLAKTNGFVTNYFGRQRRMPQAKFIDMNLSHSELPYEDRNLLNLAVNHRIQSTGASLINRAAIAFHNNTKTAGINCKIVSQIHDELVIECNEQDAENVSLLLQDAMENTNKLPGIALEAIPRISKNLSKKIK